MKKMLMLLVAWSIVATSKAQTYYQYFDGADTLATSIIVRTVPGSNNIWQIGSPHKTIFNRAATLPNAIVTDTANLLPTSDTSSFIISIHPYAIGPFIGAYQWKQKLDFVKKISGGIVEFSIDSGATWQNAFNNPHVHAFYGFNPANLDTLLSGEFAFSGTDTAWRDIWLCLPTHFSTLTDSMLVRFTVKTDSANTLKEGWMIDNIMIHPTFMHTASKILKETDAITVYPTITSGVLQISTKRARKLSTINGIELINSQGRMIHEYSSNSLNTTIDIGNFPSGNYLLRISTNLGVNTYKAVLKK